jgi:D-alanyl-D-alanine carboxypeptidase
MSKNCILFLVGCFSVLTSCSKEKQITQFNKQPLQAILDEKIKPYQASMQGKEIGIGMYIKGEDLDIYVSSGIPAAYGENIHFSGAGTTKTFTAAAIFKLQQQGKLRIDDPIISDIPGTHEPYIPNTANFNIPYKSVITIRQLLNHRAGVFDVTTTPILATVKAPYAGENYIEYLKKIHGKNYIFTFEDMIAVVAKHKLSYFVPNAAFHYSNTGYNLLAVIVERVTRKPFYQYLEEEFLVPLHMINTFFPHGGANKVLPQPAVTSWLRLENKLLPYTLDHVASARSGGDVITTPKDLSTWAYNLYAAKKVLDKKNLDQMTETLETNEQHIKYGLDAGPAYMTTMRYHPATKRTYVVFSTFFDHDNFQQQANDMDEVIREAIKEFEK